MFLSASRQVRRAYMRRTMRGTLGTFLASYDEIFRAWCQYIQQGRDNMSVSFVDSSCRGHCPRSAWHDCPSPPHPPLPASFARNFFASFAASSADPGPPLPSFLSCASSRRVDHAKTSGVPMQSTCHRLCPKLPSPPTVTAACSRPVSFDDGRSRALTRTDFSLSCSRAGKCRRRTAWRSPSTAPLQCAPGGRWLALCACSQVSPLVSDEPGVGRAPVQKKTPGRSFRENPSAKAKPSLKTGSGPYLVKTGSGQT